MMKMTEVSKGTSVFFVIWELPEYCRGGKGVIQSYTVF